MKAVTFGKCFGWLHEAPGTLGVVLCNPYGHEALWAHRGWRRLAEHLAAHGMPALRFDYPGSGDSLGNEEDGEAIQTWLEGIEDAVRYLRSTTGVTRVALCGLRLGGALAALAADRLGDIAALVMMAPTVSGREYLRELSLIQRRWRNTSGAHIVKEEAEEGFTEVLGFRMYRETTERLQALELPRDLRPRVPHMLLLDPAPRPRAQQLLQCYRSAGASAESIAFHEYTGLMSETGTNRVPRLAYAAISDWLLRVLGDTSHDADRASAAASSAPSMRPALPEPSLKADGFIETPVLFDGGRLFGIYCEPDSPHPHVGASSHTAASSAPFAARDAAPYAALFVNTAGNHHIGDARMWVVQARRLARLGIASLRMDVGALGDSAHAKETSDLSSLHDPQSCSDASTGIDWLVARGHARPVAIGVCSGAYLSFHAALANPHVASLVLVNQHAFVWSDARLAPAGPRLEPTRVYLESMRRVDKWKRLLRGETPALRIARGLAKRRAQHWWLKAQRLLAAMHGKHSVSGSVREMIRRLQERGVPIRILYGELDAGLEECELHFGKNFQWLRRWPAIHATTARTLDHALFLYPARATMMEVVEEHMRTLLAQSSLEGVLEKTRPLRAPHRTVSWTRRLRHRKPRAQDQETQVSAALKGAGPARRS